MVDLDSSLRHKGEETLCLIQSQDKVTEVSLKLVRVLSDFVSEQNMGAPLRELENSTSVDTNLEIRTERKYL